MSHKVLARKWRPNKFSDLIGQNTSVTVLKNILTSGRLHHAYLLTGTRGVGKTTIARIIAKALNCNAINDGEPCGICNNCQEISSGRFVDVIEIDAASNTGVDNIREVIENAQYIPTNGKYKVYIIDEVHMLSKAAFNAMLKTLEEPPEHIVFILATTDPQKMPITILSRCLQLKLRNLVAPEISAYLTYVLDQEGVSYEIEALDIIAKSADGSMRDALSILDQAIAYSNSQITHAKIESMLGLANDKLILHLIDAIISGNSVELTSLAQNAYQEGNDLDNILLALAHKLFEISIAQFVPHNQQNNQLSNYANNISVNDIQLYFEVANLGIEQLRKTTAKYPVFCMTLLRMLAFNIGTQQEIILDSSNFIPKYDSTEKGLSTQIKDLDDNIEPKQPTNNIPDKEQVITPVVPKVVFDGDWFDFIKQVKHNTSIYPILLSSELVSYDQNSFNIVISHNYQSVVTKSIIFECQTLFAQILNNDKFILNVTFAQELQNTLKGKIQEENKKKQTFAEESIYNDAKLNSIIEQLSATIMPNSINSI